MNKNKDIASISGRIKNLIAKKNLALGPAGNFLVNMYAHVLMELHTFAEKLPEPFSKELENLLISKENMPETVISLSTPKEQKLTPYEEVLCVKWRFKTNEEALEHFLKEYEDLGSKYNMAAQEFWMESETVPVMNEDHIKCCRLARQVQMCKYLIYRENSGE